VLVPLTVVIVVLIVTSGITLYFSSECRIAEESAEQFNRVPAAWQDQTAAEADRIATEMEVLALESRFRAAFTSRDTKSMMKHMRPLLECLRSDHGIQAI